MPLDDEARLAVEKIVDALLKNPKEYLERFLSGLRGVGIQPSLETVLAFITGMLCGTSGGIYVQKYGRSMTKDELNELIDLLERRAWELRQEFVKVFYR